MAGIIIVFLLIFFIMLSLQPIEIGIKKNKDFIITAEYLFLSVELFPFKKRKKKQTEKLIKKAKKSKENIFKKIPYIIPAAKYLSKKSTFVIKEFHLPCPSRRFSFDIAIEAPIYSLVYSFYIYKMKETRGRKCLKAK